MERVIDTANESGRARAGALLRSGLVVLALAWGAPPVPCAAADLVGWLPDHGTTVPAGRLDDGREAALASGPRLHGALSGRSVRNLRLGFDLALEAVRSNPRCGTLFTALGASGPETLGSTFYAAPVAQPGTRACAGGVAAFTTVRGRVSWLCPEFGNLHPRAAALTLIHEALHSAGMPEGPATAGALTAQEINDLVAGACTPGPTSRGAGELVAGRE